MRKLLIAIVVLIGLVVGLSPVAGGILTEQEYKKAARDLGVVEPLPGMRMTLDPALYERGLTTSKAWTTVDLPGDAGRVVLMHTIHHGPFAYAHLDDGLVLGVIESQVDPRRLRPDEESPIRLTSVMDFDGNLEVQLVGAPVTNDQFTFDGANGTITVKDQGRDIEGSIEIKGWRSAAATDPALNVDSSVLDVDFAASDAGIPLGTLRYTASALELRRNGEVARVDNLRVDQQSRLDEASQRIESSLEVAFDELELPGPGRSYREAEFVLQARNLDAAALTKIQEQRAAGVSRAQLRQVLQDNVPALIGAAPELELATARIVTDNGPASFYAKLAGRPEMANLPIASGIAALAMFELNARVDMTPEQFKVVSNAAAQTQARMIGKEEIDPALLGDVADALTRELLQKGYLIAAQENGSVRYQAELDYKGGSMLLNDQPVNPMMLLGGPQAQATSGSE